MLSGNSRSAGTALGKHQRHQDDVNVATMRECGYGNWLNVIVPLVGIALTVMCYYPGYMSDDSIKQLTQATSGHFTDWQSPLMSGVWSGFDALIPGPLGMLIFHNLMFWLGLTLLVRQALARRLWSYPLILAMGLFPPILALLGTIWKDVGMASALLLACSLLFQAQQRQRGLAWCAAQLALFYASGVRHNAAVAVLPLALWAGIIAQHLFLPRTRKPVLIGIGVGLTLFVVLNLASWTVNQRLTAGRTTYPLQQILLHDLVAISISTDQVLLPGYLKEDITIENLKSIYTINEIVPMFCCSDAPRHFKQTTDASEFSELKTTWLEVVPRHWRPYLAHRRAIFMNQLGIGRATVYLPFWSGIDPNPFGITLRHSLCNRTVMWCLTKLKDSLLFRGWLYVLILVLYLVVVFFPPFGQHRDAVWAIASSGLCYALAYLFVSTTSDFRMHWWTVVSATVVPVLFLAERINRSNRTFRLGTALHDRRPRSDRKAAILPRP